MFIQSSISTDSPYCELLDYFFSESKSELYCLNVDRNSITMTCRGSTTYPNDSEVLPPSRKAKWPADREHFWTNWRVSTKKTIETMYAECKICSDGKFYIGNMGSFSNFSRHVARKHKTELEIFVKSNKSDPKQPSMSNFTIPLAIGKRKQAELEKIIGKLFMHENISLNLVQSQLFRDFCKVSISRAFSYLLNKSTIFF